MIETYDTRAGRAFMRLDRATQIARLIAHLRAISGGQYAATRARWDATCRDARLPVISTFERTIKWRDLVAAAGLEMEPTSTIIRRSQDTRMSRALGRVAAENDAARAAHQPALDQARSRAEWPLTAFDEPRRVEMFEVAGQRVERTYYGLR